MDNKRTDEEEHALLMSLSGDTNQKWTHHWTQAWSRSHTHSPINISFLQEAILKKVSPPEYSMHLSDPATEFSVIGLPQQ